MRKHTSEPASLLGDALTMRSGIGGISSRGVRLSQSQINHYFLARIIDLENDHSKAIGALQTLGLDYCEACESWQKCTLVVADHCRCIECVANNPEALLCDGFVDDYEGAKVAIVRFLSGTGRRVKFSGELLETYKNLKP